MQENIHTYENHYNAVATDHLGSIVAKSNFAKSEEDFFGYDAWGRRYKYIGNNPTQIMFFDETEPDYSNTENVLEYFERGYTGHEHLDMFGLINMNGRLYDPVIGRMLSPDPYVQAPDFTQSFNRYSYCMNNPMMFTDPSGLWWGWDDLLIGGAGFIVGYVTHGITTGNWGWSAVGAGALGAVSAWVGYNTAGLTNVGEGITSTTWNYVGNMAINTAVSQLIPPINIPITDNLSLTVAFGFGLGLTGLTAGANLGLAYHEDEFVISAGVGGANGMSAWGVNVSYRGYGAGYYQSYYEGAEAQTVGGVNLLFDKVSFRLENDFLAFNGQDRWRTSAWELSYGPLSIGSNIYTNDPKNQKIPDEEKVLKSRSSPMWGPNTNKQKNLGSWKYGQVHSSPLWIGIRNGNNIYRVGYSHRYIQDATQNFIHRHGLPVMRQHYYTGYDHFKTGGYGYFGYYNPFSLY